MGVTAATRAGRGHRRDGRPCQDAFASAQVPGGTVFAVADGLGSRPLSHLGAQAAAEAAVARLAEEPVWDVRAMLRAFRTARRAVQAEAARHGVPASELATTLQVGGLAGGTAIAAMVGDGGMVAGDQHREVLLAPPAGGYANEVVPVTSAWWRFHFECRQVEGARWMLGFSDGLTRLLLARGDGSWRPYGPFFDAFLPKLEAMDGSDGLASRFLEGDQVDAAWDDDKCLVAVHAGV